MPRSCRARPAIGSADVAAKTAAVSRRCPAATKSFTSPNRSALDLADLGAGRDPAGALPVDAGVALDGDRPGGGAVGERVVGDDVERADHRAHRAGDALGRRRSGRRRMPHPGRWRRSGRPAGTVPGRSGGTCWGRPCWAAGPAWTWTRFLGTGSLVERGDRVARLCECSTAQANSHCRQPMQRCGSTKTVSIVSPLCRGSAARVEADEGHPAEGRSPVE